MLTVIIILVVIIAILWYIVVPIVEGALEINNAPVEPQFWCHKHGFFREQHTLDMFPDMKGINNAKQCPMCYYETVWSGPDAKLKIAEYNRNMQGMNNG